MRSLYSIISIAIVLFFSVYLFFTQPGNELTFISKKSLTIGPAYAAGAVDYTTDGTDDNVQFQQALDVLPSAGGKLVIYSGAYNFSSVVSRAIDNVIIEGVGKASFIQRDGASPVFSAGSQANWLFRDLRLDAGGIDLSLASNWVMENVWLGSTYYALRVDQNINSASLRIPTGRSSTFVVCASDASSASQCDYTADGIADDVQINAALASLPAVGGIVLLSEGTFNLSSAIVLNRSGVVLQGMGGAAKFSGGSTFIPYGPTILKVNSDINGVEVAPSSEVIGITLRGFVVDGNKVSRAAAVDCLAIKPTATIWDLVLEDITVGHCKRNGVRVDYGSPFGSNIVIERPVFTRIKSFNNDGAGFYLKGRESPGLTAQYGRLTDLMAIANGEQGVYIEGHFSNWVITGLLVTKNVKDGIVATAAGYNVKGGDDLLVNSLIWDNDTGNTGMYDNVRIDSRPRVTLANLDVGFENAIGRYGIYITGTDFMSDVSNIVFFGTTNNMTAAYYNDASGGQRYLGGDYRLDSGDSGITGDIVSGEWLQVQSGRTAAAQGPVTADTLYAVKVIVPPGLKWSNIGMEVLANPEGGSCRLGIYDDWEGRPDRLITEGFIDASSLGIKTATINKIIPFRSYWLAMLCNNSSIQTYYFDYPAFSFNRSNVARTEVGWQVVRPYGSLPTTFPFGGALGFKAWAIGLQR